MRIWRLQIFVERCKFFTKTVILRQMAHNSASELLGRYLVQFSRQYLLEMQPKLFPACLGQQTHFRRK
jgi:hypothetical protein